VVTVPLVPFALARGALAPLRSRGTPSRVEALVEGSWVDDFHAGDAGTLEDVYRKNFAHVVQVVGRYLSGADAETVTHEVFYRLLTKEKLRRNFAGGHFQAWLTRVAGNAALDCLRRRRLEQGRAVSDDGWESEPAQESCAEGVEARVLIERFRREHLPPQWEGVFEARFMRQLPQREAARELGMRRTTLVYQEQRIRALLREFLLGGEEP
jgi:RNA polymerase sigma-70 factor (ECF subfamily)